MRMPTDVFPEYYIVRVNEFNDIARTPLEEWLDYLKNNRIKDDTCTPGLKEARQRLLYMTMADADRKAYLAHMDNLRVQKDVLDTAKMEGLMEGHAKGLADGRAEGLAEGRAEGLAEGRAEGRAEGLAEGKIEMAKKLKSLGVDVKTIMQASGLTEEQIEQHLH